MKLDIGIKLCRAYKILVYVPHEVINELFGKVTKH